MPVLPWRSILGGYGASTSLTKDKLPASTITPSSLPSTPLPSPVLSPSPVPLPSPFPSLGSVPSPPLPGFPGSAEGGATIDTLLGGSAFTCSKTASASAKFVIGGGISRFSVWGAVMAGPALGCPTLPLSSWTNCTSTISSDSGVGVWI